jgi:hypothetical protein
MEANTEKGLGQASRPRVSAELETDPSPADCAGVGERQRSLLPALRELHESLWQSSPTLCPPVSRNDLIIRHLFKTSRCRMTDPVPFPQANL